MPKRSSEEMMKAIPSTSSQQQQPEKLTRISETTNSVSVIIQQSTTIETQSMTHGDINNLPNEMLDKILNELEIYEQYSLRGVCHRWKNCIEKMFALTRCLKLYLQWKRVDKYKLKRDDLMIGPPISEQSIQFESNWTEPAPKFSKRITIMGDQFNRYCLPALCRQFSHVPYLVIYFEQYNDDDNFIRMIKCFKMLESFSLISSRKMYNEHFIPKLCATLEGHPLKRLELYIVLSCWSSCDRTTKRDIKLTKSLKNLEHFALSSWPVDITKEEYRAIQQNIGGQLEKARQMFKPKTFELRTLCISMNLPKLKRLNLTKMFGSNAELQNVKRLQLTEVKSIDQVRPALELCPKLQSLELNMKDNEKKVQTNAYIEMINKCEKLTEVAIFNKRLSLYEPGPCASNIRKLTLASKHLFGSFRQMLYHREFNNLLRAEGQEEIGEYRFDSHYYYRKNTARDNYIPRKEVPEEDRVMCGPYPAKFTLDMLFTFSQVADEFVKLIALKFPFLEELNVLTVEQKRQDSNSEQSWLNFKRIISERLRARSEKLKVINIEMFHRMYYH